MEGRSPYAPPASDIAVTAVRPGKVWKGVLLGLLVDIGGSLVASIVLGIAYAVFLALQELPREQALALLRDADSNPFIHWTGLLLGSMFSVLGGYVCARIIRHQELRWGALTGVISAVIGLALAGTEAAQGSVILLFALTIALVSAGAWLGMKRNLK